MVDMELKNSLLVEAPPESHPPPIVHFSSTWKKLKGEDTIMCKEKEWVGDDNGDGNYWNAFLICDGHCGAQAAKHVSRRLWRVLKPQLPTSEPPRTPGPEASVWCKSVQRSIVRTFSQLNGEFIKENELAVANVGDSDAIMDTITSVDNISVSHRLDDNPDERQRFRKAGRVLGRLTSDLSASSGSEQDGLGPIRCWPGGLANARAIGDHHGGDEVLATPHIKQFLLPVQGARIILASDGLWDSITGKAAINISRRSKIETAADRLMTSAVYQNGWSFHDDISIVVIEVSPRDGEEFYYTSKRKMKSSSLKRKLLRAFACKVLSRPRVEEEALLDHLQILDDVDGLDVDFTPHGKSLMAEPYLDQVDSASEMEGLIFSCGPKSIEDESMEYQDNEHWEYSEQCVAA